MRKSFGRRGDPRSTSAPLLSAWIAAALLVAFTALGLNGAIHELSSARTAGQQIATMTQFGYAAAGLLATDAVLTRQPWVRLILWLWAGLASAGIAGLVIVLATKRPAV